MYLVCLTPTFNRPLSLLQNVLATFNAQDHPADQHHLIIYDDGGVFDPQSGSNWNLESTPCRHQFLGEKFDTMAQMAIARAAINGWPVEETGIAIWEDDDVGFPPMLSAHAATLDAGAQWSAPSTILANDGVGRGKWHTSVAIGRHHGAWAFTINAYLKAGGYPREMTEGFDYELAKRFDAAGITVTDTLLSGCGPLYLYRWFSVEGSKNASAFKGQWTESQGLPSARVPGKIVPQLDDETAGYYAEFGFSTT